MLRYLAGWMDGWMDGRGPNMDVRMHCRYCTVQILLAKAEGGRFWRALFEGGEEKGLYEVRLKSGCEGRGETGGCTEAARGSRQRLPYGTSGT